MTPSFFFNDVWRHHHRHYVVSVSLASSGATMTAWAQIQQEWAKNTNEDKITGVLLWDLSAAFDCLDIKFIHSFIHLHRHLKFK